MNQEQEKYRYMMNEQSFTVLFNTYWEKMYAICYHNTKDPEASRGMVQDIFRSIWERRLEFEITQSIEHYLLRAAKLKACEYLRKKVSAEQAIDRVAEIDCGGIHCTEENVLYKELSGHVDLFIDTLSCQCRKVYKMSQEQGMSNKDIASALLISEKTVSYHLVKAKEVLQSKIIRLYQQ